MHVMCAEVRNLSSAAKGSVAPIFLKPPGSVFENSGCAGTSYVILKFQVFLIIVLPKGSYEPALKRTVSALMVKKGEHGELELGICLNM